jgi:hypothetical protein
VDIEVRGAKLLEIVLETLDPAENSEAQIEFLS